MPFRFLAPKAAIMETRFVDIPFTSDGFTTGEHIWEALGLHGASGVRVFAMDSEGTRDFEDTLDPIDVTDVVTHAIVRVAAQTREGELAITEALLPEEEKRYRRKASWMHAVLAAHDTRRR